MNRYARGLSERGFRVVRFDFPGSRKNEPLERAYLAVVTRVARQFPEAPLTIGGKSMGGRIASLIASKQSLPIRGLVFFGYPLHPPGKPEHRRDAHLPNVRVPMLFVSGTRDPFASPAELRALTKTFGAKLMLVEGGDHSLEVPRSAKVGQGDVDARIWDAVADFCATESRSGAARSPRRAP